MILRGARSSSQPPSRLTASAIEHLLIATLIAIAIVTAVGTIRHSLPGALHGGVNTQGINTQGVGTQGMGTQGMGTQGLSSKEAVIQQARGPETP